MHLSRIYCLLSIFTTCTALTCHCSSTENDNIVRPGYCFRFLRRMQDHGWIRDTIEVENHILCQDSKCTITNDDVIDERASPACHRMVPSTSKNVSLCCGVADLSRDSTMTVKVSFFQVMPLYISFVCSCRTCYRSCSIVMASNLSSIAR